MNSYCECVGIEIISRYFISKGLFLITVAFGWHARVSSHSWSILAGAQAKRFSAPFSREHTFLPNVALIPCQGRWANCHFWLPATKRQRLSTSWSPVSQNGPHTLKVSDYWFFSPIDFIIWSIFSVPRSVSEGDLGTYRSVWILAGHWRVIQVSLLICLRPEHIHTVSPPTSCFFSVFFFILF